MLIKLAASLRYSGISSDSDLGSIRLVSCTESIIFESMPLVVLCWSGFGNKSSLLVDIILVGCRLGVGSGA